VRLSDADRERLYAQLSRHAAEGRLEVDELERRVALIAAAVTREEAAAAMADLPPVSIPESRATGGATRERRWGRGHGHADQPDADWQPTEERFRDPRSNRIMRVWVDSLGGRHYVPEQ
jgi:DUF1707 SHOCT-like domain